MSIQPHSPIGEMPERIEGYQFHTMNLKYVLGALFTVPLLPFMYLEGRRIRAKVPKLAEASGPAGETDGQKNQVFRLITIGESTMAGVGVRTHEEGFTGTLAKALAQGLDVAVRWRVYAKSGLTARLVRTSLLPRIQEQEADLIVIGLGGNDAFTLNRPDRWRTAIDKLIQELRHSFPNTPIVFINMPPIKEFPAFTPLIRWTVGNLVEILGQELESLIKKHDQVYYYARKITIAGWSKRLNISAEVNDYFSDGVHPSKLTYQAWANDVANFLLQEGKILDQTKL